MEALLLQANANGRMVQRLHFQRMHKRECVSAASSFLQIFADFLKERGTFACS